MHALDTVGKELPISISTEFGEVVTPEDGLTVNLRVADDATQSPEPTDSTHSPEPTDTTEPTQTPTEPAETPSQSPAEETSPGSADPTPTGIGDPAVAAGAEDKTSLAATGASIGVAVLAGALLLGLRTLLISRGRTNV